MHDDDITVVDTIYKEDELCIVTIDLICLAQNSKKMKMKVS